MKIWGESETPKIFVDYIAEHPTTYEIQFTPSATWVRKYVDGGGIKQVNFVIRSVEDYSTMDMTQNISNINFYEQLEEWLIETPPEIQGWIKVEPLTGGYIFDVSPTQGYATYQMQCRILYYYNKRINITRKTETEENTHES